MASKKKDYRALKKLLNNYYEFSFKMPRKGKDFTPQQKAAITRKYEKIKPYLKQGEIKKDLSFIHYPKKSKLKNVDAIRTSKGIIYKLPGAKVVKGKGGRYYIKANFKRREDLFIPFPKSILDSLEKIKLFVAEKEKQYKPEVVRWSHTGRRESDVYEPENFEKYFSSYGVDIDDIHDYSEDEREELENELGLIEDFIASEDFEDIPISDKYSLYKKRSFIRKRLDPEPYYNGVFFTWFK